MKVMCSAILVVFTMVSVFAQKKVLDHSDFALWNTIKKKTISAEGTYIMYALEKGEKDNFLKIKDTKARTIFEYERGGNGAFTYNDHYAIFKIKPWQDSIVALKRAKGKKAIIPSDTLGIYNLRTNKLTKIPNVKSYKTPEKWEGFLAYLLDELKLDEKDKKDKTDQAIKKVGKENGYHLVIQNLSTLKQDTIKFVTNYVFAKEGKKIAFTTTGLDSTLKAGVYVRNLENNEQKQIFEKDKASYFKLNFSDSGEKLGFVVDADTTKVQIRPNELYLWTSGNEKAIKQLDAETAPNGYLVSSDGAVYFSKDESKLYFGLRKPPIVKDTTLIDEEIVNVEVWTYNEPQLYTVQELQVENEQKRSYTTVLNLDTNKLVQIGTEPFPEAKIGDEGNAKFALASTSLPYQLEKQWEGYSASDVQLVNTETGETNTILKNIAGSVNFSPKAKYIYGYHEADSTWFTYALDTKKLSVLTDGKIFYDELNDRPKHPTAYGAAGWTENDEELLLYDRFDIWSFNPRTGESEKLTNGRALNTAYRYVELDPEARFIDNDNWLLSVFNEVNKDAGFVLFNPKNKSFKKLISGPYRYSNPIKARNTDALIYTRESFIEFPNIRISNLDFKKHTVISDANPQQIEYNWGTTELVNWTSLDGVKLTGVLVKPENFDPSKKYPMLVNFYEKSSDNLHKHKAPNPGRSTINYSFYTSRGYVIFNPDVQYGVGYPGENAYSCVIPGITSLIEKGFIDKENIGVQGHSWGGYQIAYLVTKTNIFKAAESGAPVVNMISAYGGIRWETGLSRQHQYEHTQSRIGGTPWEYPSRFIENSPIFNVDKIKTPLLIMHNDADGHVPWYQGVEFFMALRRLQKPAWLLNYNDEPHWPLKYQNRKDFNIRLQQFFDYYLKGAAKPVWMDSGVPAVEKGIHQGYQLINED